MKKLTAKISIYLFLALFGLIIIYPLLFLMSASLKSNEEIFTSLSLIPSKFDWSSYIDGWVGVGQYTFGHFIKNSFQLVIPTVLFTIISSAVTAYGFARFKFKFKNVLFICMISTLMLPNTIIIIPRYILFKNLHWLDSYLPFIIPAMFACYPFFTYMLVQFFRGIPRELDESAVIDGCNSFGIFIKIIMPLSVPALLSVAIFQFMWTWDDFFNALVYINSVSKYTVAQGLRMSLDAESVVNWNRIMAMSFVCILPSILLFFFAQKYFVEGIATAGIKG